MLILLQQVNCIDIVCLECYTSVLRSFHSYDVLIMVHYVDQQHAMTRWILSNGEIDAFGICGAARSLDQKA